MGHRRTLHLRPRPCPSLAEGRSGGGGGVANAGDDDDDGGDQELVGGPSHHHHQSTGDGSGSGGRSPPRRGGRGRSRLVGLGPRRPGHRVGPGGPDGPGAALAAFRVSHTLIVGRP